MSNRLRDFTRMTPPIFTKSKIVEDPRVFVKEIQKILVVMGATEIEKAELASYQLKDVAHTWCKMWQHSRALGGGPIILELFKKAFLGRFFPER